MPEQIQVNQDPKLSKGRYANMVSVTVQDRDVVIDFYSHVRLAADQNRAELVSRVFLNHFTAQELVGLLQQVHKQWEDKKYNAVNNEGAKTDAKNP